MEGRYYALTRTDHEHEWIQHDLVTSQDCGETYHQCPIEAKRYCNKADREFVNSFSSTEQGDDHDEEQQCGSTYSVLTKSDDEQERVLPPQSLVCQHTSLICNETKKPAATLFAVNIVNNLDYTEKKAETYSKDL